MNSNGKVYVNEGKKPFCRLKTLASSSLDFFANCWVDSEDYWDVYYYVVESVYNEFKKNNISVPYNQLEVRSRVDNVVMPFDKNALPERVEKVRKKEEHFDLETTNLSDIFKGKRKNKDSKKAEKAGKKAKKAEAKTEETK